jgi:hypothetical protein
VIRLAGTSGLCEKPAGISAVSRVRSGSDVLLERVGHAFERVRVGVRIVVRAVLDEIVIGIGIHG